MNRDRLATLNRDLDIPNNNYNYNNNNRNNYNNNIKPVTNDDFEKKLNYLQNELDITKSDIMKIKTLGTQIRTTVNTQKTAEINSNINRLNSEVSERLRNISSQLINLSAETKKKHDKNTSIHISMQKKLAKDLKDTLQEFNNVKEANHKEAYQMFRRQYKIDNSFATEEEIQQAFDNDSNPYFVQKLAGSQFSKSAYKESQDINAEMKKIERSIEELLNTFQDMQTMLATQNEVMVTIDENIDQADVAVTKGSKELTNAVELSKHSRKLKWIITGIIAAVIFIFFMIYIYPLIPKDDNNNNNNQTQ
ncbi:t-SNARE [Anaeromyces robustus]|uniref:t-SNARE n=1 Tax=Anaeromyces robustus TaxID=1754192 RepID=A0A1Y1VS47_9FUNG|nr:t-SNARE [Anaeromyces robustus]|eukprot:ORX63865.1 t-SNARE [Anaeromyces robustus]